MLTYKSSSGTTAVDPTPEHIRDSLFNDAARWSQSPDVLLTYSAAVKNAKLLVAYAPLKGYYVQYNSGSLWILVLNKSIANREAVEIDQDYEVSAGLLCNEELTWRAVEWFIRTGDRCPTLIWMSDHELPDGVVHLLI